MTKRVTRRGFTLTVGAGALFGCDRQGSEQEVPTKPQPNAESKKPSAAQRAASLFVGHGAPTLALDQDKGAPLREWAAGIQRPSSILVVSAHWVAPRLALGAERTLPLIYDFSGFPSALRQVEYAAPGAPELAEQVRKLLGAEVSSESSRAWDHGVWTPLVHLFPKADVPLLQMSLPSHLSPRQWFDVGSRLAPLREQGVLLLASGNLTHNLRRMQPDGSPVDGYAVEFDTWCTEVLTARDFDTLLAFETKSPRFRDNHPTAEHFLPLLFSAGTSHADDALSYPVTGFEYGSLSRRAVAFG